MKSNEYKINNYIERILNGKNTLFLDQSEFLKITSKLKKEDYKIYSPYKDSERVILYSIKPPQVSLYRIKSTEKLKHQDILGSILGLNISQSYIGDIIIDNDNYYFYILDDLSEFIENNLTKIGSKKVNIEKCDLSYLEQYERKYDDIEIIVSSLRIDNVLSKLIGTNREEIIKKIKEKEIMLNYKVLNKNSYVLKENDIFSIRRYGKFKYINIIKLTKKNNYIIIVKKYI